MERALGRPRLLPGPQGRLHHRLWASLRKLKELGRVQGLQGRLRGCGDAALEKPRLLVWIRQPSGLVQRPLADCYQASRLAGTSQHAQGKVG